MSDKYDIIDAQIGLKIREIRLSHKYTQGELSYRSGLTPAQIGVLELGKKSPTAKTLYKVATGLDVSLSEVVDIDNRYVETVTSEFICNELQKAVRLLDEEDQLQILGIIRTMAKMSANKYQQELHSGS